MRFLWYAGSSTALAAGVVLYAFNQRANFYSAMVYLSQNNLSLMIIINLVLLVYSIFVYGLQRLCYGQLRPVEVEQLYEKAWFAVTETCLAMTIFREEVGAWFLVMFTALVTGKVWEWIGEGRVEVLEQQPPTNPRLFHTRLSISLLISVIYDAWLFLYAVNTVIIQARPNMMVMFLFEFAILATCSLRTGLRYVLSLVEADITKRQMQEGLKERRKQVRDQIADILRRRESGDAAEAEAANREELPSEDDIDEMDIETPGWEAKGQWVLGLDLAADFVKLGVYVAFFGVLMMFYGLPIHIMRDLFLTTRSFLKRLSALIRYRKALQDMNKYADATQEELAREDTCIICREEMRPWNPNVPGAVERSRPKKLPCGHILHFGCLKSWLERQQVCPTCRRSVVIDGGANGDAARVNPGGQAPGQPAGNNGALNNNQGRQGRAGMRMFQFGPLRLAFAQGNPQEIAERLAIPLDALHPPEPPQPAAPAAQPAQPASTGAANVASVQAQLQDISQRLQQEAQALQATNFELQTLHALMAEVQRLRQNQNQQQNVAHLGQPGVYLPTFQPPGHMPPPPPGQLPLPAFGTVPHLTPFPPRIGTPSFSRHAVPPSTTSIPAGSPDLPEGVVIPQGWTLMPLHRADGQLSQYSIPGGGPQPEIPASSPSASQIAEDLYRASISATTPNPPDHGGTSGGDAPGAQPTGEPTTQSAAPSSQAPAEPPPVAAPTPVAPSWGGPAQLFANGGAGPSSAAESGQKEDTASDTRGDAAEEEGSSSGDKGKAKAVTVEDAEE